MAGPRDALPRLYCVKRAANCLSTGLGSARPCARCALPPNQARPQLIEAVLDWAAVRTGRTGAPNPARWKGNLQHVLRSTAEVKHHEALPYEQAPEFMARLRARNTPSAKI